MLLRKLIDPIKHFCRKIQRLFQFIPIIWNSYDWDFIYATDLFKFQLLRMSDYFDKHGHLENSKYNAQRIRLVCRLMDKVYNDEYSSEVFDNLREKYGQDAFRFSFEPTDNDLYLMKSKYESYPNAEEIEVDVREVLDKSYQKTEKAHRLLWKLVEHNIQRWWD